MTGVISTTRQLLKRGRGRRRVRRCGWGRLRAARGYGVSVAIARRELRGWLRGSAAGAVVEAAVEQLMDWPEVKTDEYRQRQEERKQRFGLAFGIDSGTAIRADRAVREYKISRGNRSRWQAPKSM